MAPFKKVTLFLLVFSTFSLRAGSQTGLVCFDTRTAKYHAPDCRQAIRASQKCIRITVATAKALDGVPCKACKARWATKEDGLKSTKLICYER
jgi:hypothetical protein